MKLVFTCLSIMGYLVCSNPGIAANRLIQDMVRNGVRSKILHEKQVDRKKLHHQGLHSMNIPLPIRKKPEFTYTANNLEIVDLLHKSDLFTSIEAWNIPRDIYWHKKEMVEFFKQKRAMNAQEFPIRISCLSRASQSCIHDFLQKDLPSIPSKYHLRFTLNTCEILNLSLYRKTTQELTNDIISFANRNARKFSSSVYFNDFFMTSSGVFIPDELEKKLNFLKMLYDSNVDPIISGVDHDFFVEQPDRLRQMCSKGNMDTTRVCLEFQNRTSQFHVETLMSLGFKNFIVGFDSAYVGNWDQRMNFKPLSGMSDLKALGYSADHKDWNLNLYKAYKKLDDMLIAGSSQIL